jgi:DNA-binding transcriptional LysR family regulator
MEAFVVVVDTGSFTAAARRLNVGQPAVSKLVAQLEDRLGVKLLVRTTRGLTATEAGLNYYDRARRMIEEVDEAELAARGAGSGLTGRLRICGAVTFARIHLMPVIRNLKWKSFWTIETSTSFKRGSMSPSAWGSSLTPARPPGVSPAGGM